MLFTSPIWLLGLLPWSVVALLVFLGQRPRQNVSFLELWRHEIPKESVRCRFARPPLGALSLLLASLLAILAAAGPAIRRPGGGLTIIVDAGASMSARGDRKERFREMLAAAAGQISADAGASTPIELIVVPRQAMPATAEGSVRTTAGNLPALAEMLHPTALATTSEVALAAERALARSTQGVLVISDCSLDVSNGRLRQNAPERSPFDLGILQLSVRRTPRPEAMIRIRQLGAPATKSKQVMLRLSAGGASQEKVIAPLPAGGVRNLFMPLPATGPIVTAELIGADDDFSGDDRADVMAESDWPAIEPATPVGDLQKLLILYSTMRPAGDASVHVRLVPSIGQLGTSAGIVLPPLGGGTPERLTHVTTVRAHPITSSLPDWPKLDLPQIDDRAAPPDWDILLSDERGPLLAVHQAGSDALTERPPRQVWTAIAASGWSNRPEYVIFWSAVLDWTGRAADHLDEFRSSPLADLPGEWQPLDLAHGIKDARAWPGIYERALDGTRRAFGPSAALQPSFSLTDAERSKRVAAVLGSGENVSPISPWVILVAMVMVCGAAATWPRRATPYFESIGSRKAKVLA